MGWPGRKTARQCCSQSQVRSGFTPSMVAQPIARESASVCLVLPPFIPTAQFILPTAYRSNLSGVIIAPVTFLWNVDKK